MKLKHNTSRRGKPASLLSALTGKWGKRHRLPAHVTGEKDWEVEVPQIHMSRAFAVMLVLFIVGVGGLFAFQMFGKEDKKTSSAPAEQGASSLAALEVSGSPGPAVVMSVPVLTAAPEIPADIELPEPARETPVSTVVAENSRPQTYIWKTGDTMALVAAQFNLPSYALRSANPDKPLLPGTQFIIPNTGRMIDAPDAPAVATPGATILDPLADRKIAEAAPPKAEVVPELPDIAESGEDTPAAPPKLVEKTTSKPVATRTTPREDTKSVVPSLTGTKPASASAPKNTGQRTHVVAKGDTVFNIARRFGIPADEIVKANGLDSNFRIRPGQPLKLPVRR